MKKLYFLFLFFACASGLAQAQTYKLSKESAQFILDVKAMMGPTKNENAVKVATRLEEIWGSNQMTSSQQAKVIELSQKMLIKKMKARPHFENFYGALVSGINIHRLRNAELDEFISVVEKSLEREKLPEYEKFLQTAYSFLNTKIIYKSAQNTLRVVGGSFSFAYHDGTEPAEEEPVPVKAAPTPKTAEKKAPKTDEVIWNDDFKDTTPATDANPAPANLAKGEIPALLGPVLKLQNMELFFITGPDSLSIKNSDGTLLMAKNYFVGKKGLFAWVQPDGEASATIKKFGFDTSRPAFRAQDVILTYPAVLEAPVEGVFEFRNIRKKAGGDTGYPRFISFTNNAQLKNIGENIKYRGGFSMAGSKISAAALDGSGSEVTVSLDGKPKFKATSVNFQLQDSLISSEKAAILIFNNQDSIAHPGLRLKYSKTTKKLSLIQSEQSQASPFYSSHHQMEINAEMLTWDLASSKINFSILTAKNEVPARLTSKEYFTEDRYEHLKGTADFHPLIVFANFSDKRRSNNFFLHELTESTKIKEAELRVAANMLARQNFLDYNSTTGEITLKSKAYHYMKSARGKKDYDYITLKSLIPSGKNATLDLNKNELLVRGVDKFYFTGDSVAVYAQPDSNQVRVLKNRDIKFNGVVVASNFRFRGSKFTFKYNDFLIDMAKIDTVAFAVKKKQKKGAKQPANDGLSSHSITKSSGVLYLNKADNKSGRKKYGKYPSFDATSGAYVYFNKPEILGGAYDTTVYFAIPPFKLDSLNSSVPGAVGFKGKFYSGGIFPPIETQLAIMDDQSLGFTYTSPKTGLAAYGGKGKFFNKLTMSKKGLQGLGEVEYLTTRLKSNAFTFYLDKVHTLGTEATIKEATVGNAYYMGGTFNKYVLEWLPLKDTMNISTVSQPFNLYQNKYSYRGMAIITPTGFYGDGTVEGTDGYIKSPNLAFAKDKFKANRATLDIKSKTPGKPALRASDIFLEFDVTKGLATFSPEKTGAASTDFPNAQFKTSLSGGKWDVNKKIITMNEQAGMEGGQAYFVSVRPAHENLKFKAKSATYDIGKNTLRIGGVPYIAVADAHIVPDSGRVYITDNADLKTLQKASVISDTLNRYHQMYKGEVDVVSRLSYRGYAQANYVNALSDTFAVKFGKFAMKNMDKVKAQDRPVLLAMAGDADAPSIPGGINTEILPDDTTSIAVPVRKKGRFKKVKLSPDDGTTPDAVASAAMATEQAATTRKNRKAALKKSNSRPDSTLLAVNTDLPEKRERFRFSKKSEEVAVDDLPHTEAVAAVKETDNFFITSGVQYKGDISMSSNRQFWNFDGFVKLRFSGQQGGSDWFPYKSTVNPAEVTINIEAPKLADGTPLKTGLHVGTADNKIYNTFVSKKKDDTDLDIFEVEGLLAFNKNKKEYKVGKQSRLSGEDFTGNLMTYSDSTGIARYEGKLNLLQSTGKNFGLTSSGMAQAKPSSRLYTIDAFLAFDLGIPEAALVQMGNVLADNLSGAPDAITENGALLYKLAQFVPGKEAKAYADKSNYTPLPVFATKFQKLIVFNAAELRWSDSTKAWYSKNRLSLANVLKRDINAQVPGYLEIKRGPDSDIVTLYLQPNPEVWYYFSYENSMLTVASSDDKFNSLVASKRNSSMLTGEEMDKTAFANNYRKTYLANSKHDPILPGGAIRSAPQKSGNFDFMEDTGKKKKKEKASKAEESDLPTAKPEKANNEVNLPGTNDDAKKKKKNKKGKEEELLPDMN